MESEARAIEIAAKLSAVPGPGGVATQQPIQVRQVMDAFLVGEATMAQRISRAKQRIKASGVPFRMPTREEQAARLRSVLRVLSLIFNEGYTSSTGPRRPARTNAAGELIPVAEQDRRLWDQALIAATRS